MIFADAIAAHLDIFRVRALGVLVHVLAQVQLHKVHDKIQTAVVPQHIPQPMGRHINGLSMQPHFELAEVILRRPADYVSAKTLNA